MAWTIGGGGIGLRFSAEPKDSSLQRRVYTWSGVNPAVHPVCFERSARGVKRPGREAEHAYPPTTELKMYRAIFYILHTYSWRGV